MNKKDRMRAKERIREKYRSYLCNSIVKVITTFGPSLIPASSQVIVKAGNKYFKKEARFLKPDETILFEKEGIPNISIEEVEQHLLQSESYRRAMGSLFIQNIPALRYVLFSSLKNESDLSAQFDTRNFEQLLFKEDGKDFDDEVYTRCAQFIHNVLEKGGVQRTLEHVKYGWLGGRTVMPRNPEEIFDVLSKVLPSLSGFYSESRMKDYKFYVVVRQGIMRMLSLTLNGGVVITCEDADVHNEFARPVLNQNTCVLMRCEGTADRNEKDEVQTNSERINVKKEAEHIILRYISNVDERLALGRVVSVDYLPRSHVRNEVNATRCAVSLRRGIVGDESKVPSRVFGLREMVEDRYAHDVLINHILMCYFEYESLHRAPPDESILQHITEAAKVALGNMVGVNIVARNGINFLKSLMKEVDKNSDDFFGDEHYENAFAGMVIAVSGPLDDYLKNVLPLNLSRVGYPLDYDKIYELVRVWAEGKNSLPDPIVAWSIADKSLFHLRTCNGTRNDIEFLEIVVNTLREEIINSFGFDVEEIQNKISKDPLMFFKEEQVYAYRALFTLLSSYRLYKYNLFGSNAKAIIIE